eukprot:326422_1
MADRGSHKYQDVNSPKRSRNFKRNKSPENTSKQIQSVYANLIGKATLSSPTQELPFSADRGNKVQSPKHVTSPHKAKASQFAPSDAYKSRMDREVQSHLLSEENRKEVEPKVMLPHNNKSNMMQSPPRKIEIYRKRKLYQSQNIAELLCQRGIDYDKYDNKTDHLTGKPAILSLFIFDNTEYEIHSPQEWLHKSIEDIENEDANQSKAYASAKALKTKLLHNARTWEKCSVVGYDEEKQMYQVIWDGDKTEEMYCKSRLEVLFDAEDPVQFAERLKEAHYLRRKYEAYIRYALYVDNMPTDDVSPIGNEQVNRILQSALSTPKISMMDASSLLEEVNIEWQRTMNKIIFDKNLYTPQFKRLRDSDELRGLDIHFLMPPNTSNSSKLDHGTLPVENYNFAKRFQDFSFHSFFTRNEAYAALKGVQNELLKLYDQSLLVGAKCVDRNVRLEDFEQLQLHKINATCSFIKRNWMNQVKSCITGSLRDSGKGWFNLRERNREVYLFSKLRKLLQCTNMKMEDTLRFMIEASLTDYYELFRVSCTDIGSDITPLFSLDLIVSNGEVVPITPLQQFIEIPLQLFEKCLHLLRQMPQIEYMVMEPLFSKGGEIPIMRCVQFAETLPQDLYAKIRELLSKSLEPIEQHIALFSKYKSLFALNVDHYTKEFFAKYEADPESLNPGDIEKEIAKHKQRSQQIKNEIPKVVRLGLFSLKLESVRNAISDKHKQIARQELSLFLDFTRTQCNNIGSSFSEIKKRLRDPRPTVEALSEMKEFISGIPQSIDRLQPQIDLSMQYFQLLEDFNYKLDRTDFGMKWQTFGWAKTIDDEIARVNTTMTDDKKKYYEQLKQQQAKFETDFEDTKREINEFNELCDVAQTNKIAIKARNLQCKLTKLQEQSTVFNSKEAAFDCEITDYKEVSVQQKKFDPFLSLWNASDSWNKTHDACLNESFLSIDPYAIEKDVDGYRRTVGKCLRAPAIRNNTKVQNVAQQVFDSIEAFKPKMPIIMSLANEGMRERHWHALSDKLGVELRANDRDLNLTKALSDAYKLDQHIAVISKEGEKAAKEFQIEQALDKMEDEWKGVQFTIDPYKATKTYRLLEVEDIMQQLDEHRVTTQAMQFSAFKAPFEERIKTWDNKLSLVSEVIDEWLMVQRNWLHLQPIFDSADIMKQLPTEGKKFNAVDRLWRQTMDACNKNPNVLIFADNDALLLKFKDATRTLDVVQRGLSDYLNAKRASFSRFYFLSDDELLQILSQTKDVEAVQPHIKKCFESIKKLKFDKNLQITAMYSSSGEEFPFNTPIDPTASQVEFWLGEVEQMMQQSLQTQLNKSYVEYFDDDMKRTDWIKKSFGQSVLTVSQVAWTKEVESALNNGQGIKGIEAYGERMQSDMDDTVEMVRGKLDKLVRINVGALIVLDVHNLNTVKHMVSQNVDSVNDFEWIKQLRYYLQDSGSIQVQMVQASFPYGYEYQGNSFRLVITPLTERCYMTLMSALQLHLGGAPAGPAGTGKTETVKDLAKNVAKQCVVFNCSDSLDHLAMAKFFKGLAMSGAWACFDEFNRIDIEVLSVVAQQISSIWNAIKAQKKSFIFEETEISLNPTCCTFITMNPGYAGRTELPDNLVALFRPVAMMVPDYALIAEIMLYSYGFNRAEPLSKKMVATFTLCSEQLSSQDHYDYGMRAVKSVIVQAGNLKKKFPNKDEELILLRALCDANVPKFLAQDLVLFEGIISDLFPGKSKENTDYGLLLDSLLKTIESNKLQRKQEFVLKVFQLYDVMCVRHGLMLVGPTGGGKTTALHCLRDAITQLAEAKPDSGFHKVQLYTLNPKAVTMGELYGEFDGITHEWTDGLVPTVVRECVSDTTLNRKWVCFDGVVDTLWIESMNTVLDDNKKLCLTSGEIISLSDEINMIFEVEDLSVASPATVSRCGMIYMDPESLGLDAMIQSWLQSIDDMFSTARKSFNLLFNMLFDASVEFIRNHCIEPVPSVDNNLCRSLMNVIDCLLEPFVSKQAPEVDEEDRIPKKVMDAINAAADSIFIYALIWSVGATTNSAGRKKLDAWLKLTTAQLGLECVLPNDGMLYDYLFDLEKQEWVQWTDTVPKSAFNFDHDQPFGEIIVPTQDSIRYTYLLDILMKHDIHTLFTGDTGTGKTVNVQQYINTLNTKTYQPLIMIFSAATTAKQIQNTLDERLDSKRRQCVYGPPLGTRCVYFVDDLNMPQREIFGAQPPIEFIRQWCDHSGWWKRIPFHTFCTVLDIVMIGAMGPPGGGRNPVSSRFLRHFNQIAHTDLEFDSLFGIFNTILNSKMSASYAEDITSMIGPLVKASIEVYLSVCESLLPTPSKSHYTFNLRDLSSVHQGLLQCASKHMDSVDSFLRLWIHENRRVFQDRLINDEDRKWFDALLVSKSPQQIECDSSIPLLFCDFIGGASEERSYQQVTDSGKLQTVVLEWLEEYNVDVGASMPMNLVLFADAIEHICRISRILSLPQGNALLLGVGGSGRQSLSQLASYIGEFNLFRIEIAKNYGRNEWRDDMKRLLMQTGLEQKQTVFLFSDNQIVQESFMEDINNILNSGDIPGLWLKEDLDQITEKCKIECLKKKIEATKLNIYKQFLNRIRHNLHIIMCMSPMGEEFRTRLRMFPALVNCCTIDWFKPWPADALSAVAQTKLQEASLTVDPVVVEMFVFIHQSVEKKAEKYAQIMDRYSYVTPTSYLELLKTFKLLYKMKKDEISDIRDKLQNGVSKLDSAAKDVAALQIKLREMQPVLKKTQIEVEEMMVVIAKDKEQAAKDEAVVSAQEQKASAKAAECAEIKADAENDLAKALPALKAATSCLNDLKKSDIDEVRAFRNPPGGVRLTMEVACKVLGVAPVKKKDPATMKKYDDFWEAAQKSILSDAKKFLETLVTFDKDSLTEKIVSKISPYMSNPAFTVAEIEKASKACRAICMWSHAMHTYFYVARDVEPKRKKLAEATATLEVVNKQLAEAKGSLQGVMDKLASLQAKYDGAVAEKERLANEVVQCSVKLERAEKLIGGLGGEKARWSASVIALNAQLDNVMGDVVLSSGAIAYVGAFTSEYRLELFDEWRKEMVRLNLRHTESCDVVSTLGKQTRIRGWNICGLPTDTLSIENGIILDVAQRWPLMIDPQNQASRFIKSLAAKEAVNGFDVVKLTDGKTFTRALENGIRFGKWVIVECVEETLDPQLEPILQRAVFEIKGQLHIRLGDSTIPYNSSFKLFLISSLPNPYYPPELQVKVTLLNFTVTRSGLQDQMLGLVVAKEAPELELKKNELVLSSAAMKKELEEIEDKILKLLSESTGDILDDENLINVLSEAKQTSAQINTSIAEQEVVEAEIDEARQGYVPVAFRASILYFAVADLSPIDPMYQFSLLWFVALFCKGIDDATSSDVLSERLMNINSHFTRALYASVCRSLFEKHKLLFSFLLTCNILRGDDAIDMTQYRYLVSVGHEPLRTVACPVAWLDENTWKRVAALERLAVFDGIVASFSDEFSSYYDSVIPHQCALPEPWQSKLTQFEKLIILRALRPDKMNGALQDFIASSIGAYFIEPPPFDLASTFSISTSQTPLVFILSSGADPYADLLKFAGEEGETDKLLSISLGMGQGPIAERYIRSACEHGGWVVLQNCHLCVSWLPSLEKICSEISVSPDIHPSFRLWLTSMPTRAFPVSILQRAVKMTNEPPKGLRANLLRSYLGFSDDFLANQCKTKANEFKIMLFGLCMYHALILDRRKYGALGWNIPYGFRESDLRVCIQQLHDFLDMFDEIPFRVIHFLIYDIHYGGRVTDNTDRRTSRIILDDFICPDLLNKNYAFSASGKYYSIDPTQNGRDGYIEYIKSLDLVPQPEVFGFHDNADITFATEESDHIMSIICGILPRTSGGSGQTKDECVAQQAQAIAAQCPDPINIEAVQKQYPTTYSESMNTVLVQEAIRYNKLLRVMRKSLLCLQRAIRGEMVMTTELETMANSLFDNIVPANWQAVAYPSLKPLSSWVADLLTRLEFIHDWISNGTPTIYWISGFFFPQAFLTGTLQNYARKHVLPIDTVSFEFHILSDKTPSEPPPEEQGGCYINGLFIEGCRWNHEQQHLDDSKPKELFVKMPVIWLKPVVNRKTTDCVETTYKCPVYKILTRRGQLSTTGHSTNFVMNIELPSKDPMKKWVKAGVAMFCALKY